MAEVGPTGRAREPERPGRSAGLADVAGGGKDDARKVAEAANLDRAQCCGARKRGLAEAKNAERSGGTARCDERKPLKAFDA